MDRTLVDKLLSQTTTTVPVAAQVLGISRNAGYEAARRGELPTLKFGKRLVVPTSALRRMLSIEELHSAQT